MRHKDFTVQSSKYMLIWIKS